MTEEAGEVALRSSSEEKKSEYEEKNDIDLLGYLAGKLNTGLKS